VTRRHQAGLAVLLAGLAAGCPSRCDRLELGDVPLIFVGALDAARLDAVDPTGAGTMLIAAPPTIDAPVRAIRALADGMLVLQEPEVCDGGSIDPGSGACVPADAPRRAVPPGVVLSRALHRAAPLAAVDAGGTPLFTWAEPPWAVDQDRAGRLWVTGRSAPVVYGTDGAVALAPDPLPYPTRGVAALPDGRVVVSYGVQDLAVYRADGTVAESIATDLGPDLQGIDALLARPDGSLLLATERFGVTSSGVLLHGRLDPGALTLLVDPAQCASLAGGLPSAISSGDGVFFTAPPLGRLAPPQCGRRVSGSLRADLGCFAPEPHHGAAWVE
jgi:hypothetical protein